MSPAASQPGFTRNCGDPSSPAGSDRTPSVPAGDILPNIFAVIMVLATVELGGFILAEATISFLGYGVPPPTPTWGQMLSGSGAQYMLQQPGMAFWPGFALAIVVFGFNMLGDALRDVIDPRLRGSR